MSGITFTETKESDVALVSFPAGLVRGVKAFSCKFAANASPNGSLFSRISFDNVVVNGVEVSGAVAVKLFDINDSVPPVSVAHLVKSGTYIDASDKARDSIRAAGRLILAAARESDIVATMVMRSSRKEADRELYRAERVVAELDAKMEAARANLAAAKEAVATLDGVELTGVAMRLVSQLTNDGTSFVEAVQAANAVGV